MSEGFLKVELLKWLVEGLVVEHDSLEEGTETELRGWLGGSLTHHVWMRKDIEKEVMHDKVIRFWLVGNGGGTMASVSLPPSH